MYENIAPSHNGAVSVFGMTEIKLENGNSKWSFTPTGYWESYTEGKGLEINLKGEEAETLALQMSQMENIVMNTNRQKEMIVVEEGTNTVLIRKGTSRPVEINLKDKFANAIKKELDKEFDECRIVSFYSFTERTLSGKVNKTVGRKMFVDEYEIFKSFVVGDIVVEVDGKMKELSTIIRSSF